MAISKKDAMRARSDQLAEKIKENQRIKEKKQFQEELKKRIQIARDGRLSYEKRDLPASIQNYKKFLQITARSLEVDVANLKPSLFDADRRVAESLLLSAVTFDMAKMYDKVAGANKEIELYLRLMTTFTAGMPFQAFVADNLYKYLKYTKSIDHKNDFETVYKAIKVNKNCFIATMAFQNENAPEVERLRQFRDRHLQPHPLGRQFIAFYYVIGPSLAKIIQKNAKSQAIVKKSLQRLVKILPQ